MSALIMWVKYIYIYLYISLASKPYKFVGSRVFKLQPWVWPWSCSKRWGFTLLLLCFICFLDLPAFTFTSQDVTSCHIYYSLGQEFKPLATRVQPVCNPCFLTTESPEGVEWTSALYKIIRVFSNPCSSCAWPRFTRVFKHGLEPLGNRENTMWGFVAFGLVFGHPWPVDWTEMRYSFRTQHMTKIRAIGGMVVKFVETEKPWFCFETQCVLSATLQICGFGGSR